MIDTVIHYNNKEGINVALSKNHRTARKSVKLDSVHFSHGMARNDEKLKFNQAVTGRGYNVRILTWSDLAGLFERARRMYTYTRVLHRACNDEPQRGASERCTENALSSDHHKRLHARRAALPFVNLSGAAFTTALISRVLM